jgi:hypothetical protein
MGQSTIRRHLEALETANLLRMKTTPGVGVSIDLVPATYQNSIGQIEKGDAVLSSEQKSYPNENGQRSGASSDLAPIWTESVFKKEHNFSGSADPDARSEAVDADLEQNLESSSMPLVSGTFLADLCKGLEAAGASMLEVENLRQRLSPFDDPRLSGTEFLAPAARLLEGYRLAGGIGPEDPRRFYEGRCKAAGISPDPSLPHRSAMVTTATSEAPCLTPQQRRELEDCQESLRRQRPGSEPEFVELVSQATSRAAAAGRIRTSITQHFFGTAQSMLRQENGS